MVSIVVIHQSQCVVRAFGREAIRICLCDVESEKGNVGCRNIDIPKWSILVVRRDGVVFRREEIGYVLVPVVRVELRRGSWLVERQQASRDRLCRIPDEAVGRGSAADAVAMARDAKIVVVGERVIRVGGCAARLKILHMSAHAVELHDDVC